MFWAPLPFGGAEPLAELVQRLTVCTVLLLIALRGYRSGRLRHLRWPLLACAALALLALVQSLPLPGGLVATLSPEHGRLFAAAGELLGEPVTAALSLAPSASRSAALGWAFVGLYLLAGGWVACRRRNRRGLALAVAAVALFEIFYGTSGWLSGGAEIWGRAAPATDTRLRGTFVNSDHLATLFELVLAMAFAWGWWALRRGRWSSSIERRLALAAPPLLLWLAVFAGLAFTGSRAGLVAAVVGAGLQGVLLAVASGRARWAPVGLVAALAGILVVVFAGLGQGFGRLLSTSVFEVVRGGRAQAYEACLELWQRFPIFGSGAGSFRDAFPLVQPATLPGTWLHAHNDPLELLVTHGLLGILIFVAGAFWLVRRQFQVLRFGERSEDRATALAALGAVATMAVHECFDFGLTVPSNSLAFAVLCGAALVAKTADEEPTLAGGGGR
ncbi:MAG: O-antigen ligase family protein [Acidobacteriota bacterium]